MATAAATLPLHSIYAPLHAPHPRCPPTPPPFPHTRTPTNGRYSKFPVYLSLSLSLHLPTSSARNPAISRPHPPLRAYKITPSSPLSLFPHSKPPPMPSTALAPPHPSSATPRQSPAAVNRRKSRRLATPPLPSRSLSFPAPRPPLGCPQPPPKPHFPRSPVRLPFSFVFGHRCKPPWLFSLLLTPLLSLSRCRRRPSVPLHHRVVVATAFISCSSR
jgi:hypothetical protein